MTVCGITSDESMECGFKEDMQVVNESAMCRHLGMAHPDRPHPFQRALSENIWICAG